MIIKGNVTIFQTTKTHKYQRFKMVHDACKEFPVIIMLQFLNRLSFPATRRGTVLSSTYVPRVKRFPIKKGIRNNSSNFAPAFKVSLNI